MPGGDARLDGRRAAGDRPRPPARRTACPCDDPLERSLFDRYRIVVPVMRWHDPPARIARISAQAYNRIEQYEALAAALRAELRR